MDGFQAQSRRCHQLVYLRKVGLVKFVARKEEAALALCRYESDQGMTQRYS